MMFVYYNFIVFRDYNKMNDIHEKKKIQTPMKLEMLNDIPKDLESNTNLAKQPIISYNQKDLESNTNLGKQSISSFNQNNERNIFNEGINDNMKYGGDDSKMEMNDRGIRHFKYRGESIELVDNPLGELEICNEVIIEKKLEFVAILSGCERPNKYHIYSVDRSGRKKHLFKCKEESNWGCRNCCPGNIRSFKIKMIHIMNTNKRFKCKKTIAEFTKPFKFSCCCCFRPVLKGHYVDQQGNIGESFGEIKETLGCNPSLSIMNEEKVVKWKSFTKYCQCGYSCRCYSCGKCYEVNFWIYNGDSLIKNSNPVGNIHKVFKGLSEMGSKTNSFVLTFPQGVTAEDKLLLIGTVLMIDYRYFETMGLLNCSIFC